MSTLGSIWFVESQGSTELSAVLVGRNNSVLGSLFKVTKVLLDEYEIYRRSCFDGVKSGDSFNVGIEGSNGVFISEFSVDDHPISINGFFSFWMDDHNECSPFIMPDISWIDITKNSTINSVKTACNN